MKTNDNTRPGDSVLPRDDRQELPQHDATAEKFTGFPVGHPLGKLLELKESALIDRGLQERIRGRLALPNISQADIARSARISGSMLSKWLANKPEGDWRKLEEVLDKWDQEFDEREDLKRDLKPTAVTDWIIGAITRLARRKKMGIVTAPAGVGKTCGCQLYCAQNTRAVMLTAGIFHGNAQGMVNELWVKSRARRRQSEKGLSQNEILKLRWKGSDTPILIDEFDKLTVSGLAWVKDFFDGTECPIFLTGNYAGLTKIKRLPDADQWTSRVGEDRKLPMDPKGKTGFNAAAQKELADLMLCQYAPEHRERLARAAFEVCGKRGHARRLKHQLQMMLDLMDGGENDALEAFRLAPSQMLILEEP